MSQILKDLDSQQQEAVKHTTGPGLIVAGAGSGKTTTLVRRVCQLIENNEDPSSILLLTFTRNAAKSIISRARSFMKEAEKVQGGTFHSIGYKLIKENHDIFDLPQNFSIIDPDDTQSILAQITSEYNNSKKLLPTIKFIQEIITFSRNTERNIKEVLDTLYPEQSDHCDYLEEVKSKYDACKKENYLLDYDDLLLFWAVLAEHPEISKQLCNRFSHVMIDEHQDSNKLQLRIIYGMKYCKSIVAVGDPSQAIFKFRGSCPETMFDFLKVWPETKTYLLENNYRSTKPIIELANGVDSKMANRFERKLISNKESKIIPKLITIRNKIQEAREICDVIATRSNQGITLDKQAILVRSSSQVRHIEQELVARKIPYMFLGGIKLHETAHIKDLVSALRIGNNPKDLVSWSRLLECLPKVGKKTSKSLIDDIMKFQTLKEIISFFELASIRRENLKTIPPILELLNGPWKQCIIKISEIMEPILIEKYKEEYKWRKRDLDTIIEMASGHDSLEEFVNNLSLDMHLDRKMKQEEDKKEEALLTVSTVHSAKGLEWECVYIPSFIHGHFPSNFAVLQDDKEEELRLFYVAVTRAKIYLDFYKPLATYYGDKEMLANDSAFESHIEDYVDKISKQDVPYQSSYKLDTRYKLNVR